MHFPRPSAFSAILVHLATLSCLFTTASASEYAKALFLFKDVLQSNTTALTTSGFNTLIVFRIGVLPSGDLVYYSTGDAGEPVDAPVITDGVYVGGPALADKIRGFKTGHSSVDRVEISVVSHDTSFAEIRDWIDRDGTGPESLLHRHFSLLKDAWDLDGFNNDDESLYDVSSTVEFALLLGRVGYRYSIAPYTNRSFWAAVTQRINAAAPNLVDKVFLQVYDGGAANTPEPWAQDLDMKIVTMEWVTNDAKPSEGTTPLQCRQEFEKWHAAGTIEGAGYWNEYDIEKMGLSYTEYADVLNDIFG